MPAVNATVGSASANSFATVAECDSYCDARLNASAWNNETDDEQKVRALISATRELNTLPWNGHRASSTQSLAWPMFDAPNVDDPWQTIFASTVIPQRVKDATCELALQFLLAGATDLSALDTTTGILEKTVDVLTTRYAEPYLRPAGLARFPSVMRFITPLLASTGCTIPLVRG